MDPMAMLVMALAVILAMNLLGSAPRTDRAPTTEDAAPQLNSRPPTRGTAPRRRSGVQRTTPARPATAQTAHPFGVRSVDMPLRTAQARVDIPRSARGKAAPRCGRTARERGRARTQRKPPHLAVTFAKQPLHLVVLALTTATHRRIVLEVTRPTETPKPRPAIGTIRRPGARHAGASEQRRQRKRGSYRAGMDTEEHQMARATTSGVAEHDTKQPKSEATGKARPAPATPPPGLHPPPRRPVRRELRWHDENGKPAKGLTFERRWTRPGVHPYDEITWEYRTAGIANESGKSVFEQKDVEVPSFWSQLATNVVVSPSTSAATSTPRSARPASSSSSIASSTRSRPGPRPSATSRATRTWPPSRPS